jgi:hypothetical protein
MYSMNPLETYLLNPGMADAALLLVLVRPVEMLDVGVLLQLLLREELLLAQVARQPETNGKRLKKLNKFTVLQTKY